MPYLLTYFISIIFVSIAVISSNEPASLGVWAILPFFSLFLALPIWGALWLSLKLLRFIPVVKDSDYVKGALEKETQAREIRKEKRAQRKKQKLELKLQARAEREKRERKQNERIKAQSLREKNMGFGLSIYSIKSAHKKNPRKSEKQFYAGIYKPLKENKLRKDLSCAWCGNHHVGCIDGSEEFVNIWLYRNSDGSKDKRIRDNKIVAQVFHAMWTCRNCGALTITKSFAEPSANMFTTVHESKLAEEGIGNRIAEDFTTQSGEIIQENRQS